MTIRKRQKKAKEWNTTGILHIKYYQICLAYKKFRRANWRA